MDAFLNQKMERLFQGVIRHPVIVLLLAIVLFLGFASQLSKLQKDSRADAFLAPDNPALVYKNKVKEAFGLSDPMVVAVANESVDGIYTPANLQLVERLSDELKQIENIDPDRIVSLATENNITGYAEGMEVVPFFDPVPETMEQALAVKAAVDGFPLFQGNLVARDNKVTLIIAQLLDQNKAEQTYRDIRVLVDALDLPEQTYVHVAGEGAISGFLGSYIDADGKRLNPLALLIILVMLIIAFRRFFAAVAGLFVIVVTILSTLGIMAASEVAFFVITNSMPVILIGIAVADTIHILGRYYEEALDQQEAGAAHWVMAAMMDMWRPVTLTSLTTACGFLGMFFAAYMPPFKYYGAFTALGVMFALLFSLLALPALLMLIKPKASKRWVELAHSNQRDWFANLMLKLGTFSVHHARAVVTTFAIIGVISLILASQLKVDYNRIDAFNTAEPIYQADQVVNGHMDGVNFLDVVIETDEEEGIFDPEVLRQMEALQDYAVTLDHVNRTTSIVDYLKQMNVSINENNQDEYRLPDDRDLIAQYFLLYSASSDPTDFQEEVDYEYRTALIRLHMDSSRYSHARPVIEALEQYIDKNVTAAKANLSGRVHVNYHWIKDLGASHFLGVGMSLFLVWLVSAVLFNSIAAGLLSLLPVFSSITLVYAAMVLLGIDLGIGPSMFASVAIGLGVDFAIHTIDRLRQLFSSHTQLSDAELDEIMKDLFPTTGRALLFNYLAIAFGFGVLISSKVVTLNEFGIIVVLAVTTSFITSLSLIPALVKLIRPRFVFQSLHKADQNTGGGGTVAGDIMVGNAQTVKNTSIFFSLLAALLILSVNVWSPPLLAQETLDGMTVEEIVGNLNAVDEGEYVSSTLNMRLVDKRGKVRERIAKSYRRYFGEEKRTILYYTEPANVEGTAFLTYDYAETEEEDDQWLYLPALRKVRRISASDRGDYFLGTDFTYEDIKQAGKIEIEDHHFALMGTDELNGRKMYKVEAIPKNDELIEVLGYNRAMIWVDAENWVSMQVDFWDVAGNPLKRYQVEELVQIDSIWTRQRIRVSHHKTGHSTEFHFENVDYQSPVDEDFFTKRALSRGI